MMFESVEPNWHNLEGKFKVVVTIDDVLKHHSDFLDACLKECMLTNPYLLKTVTKLLALCSHFSTFMSKFLRNLEDAQVRLMREYPGQRITAEQLCLAVNERVNGTCLSEQQTAVVSRR
jgi:hypothetical protein